MRKEKFRNIAIIAHVDYGKTTLMDELLKPSGTFDSHQEIPASSQSNGMVLTSQVNR